MSVFSEIPAEKILFRSKYFFLIHDAYPVSEGHLLIISAAEKQDYFDLSEAEKQELPLMIDKAKELIEKDATPDGYNIGMNCGVAAGQTVMHFHCHVIPRVRGDMKDPRGGVRHTVQGKGYY